ncbi:MAG: hypothetical protein R2839_10915 [Thermomicrobiales bacterium]
MVTGFPTFANGYTWYPVQMNGYSAGYIAGILLTKYTPTATATAPASATSTGTPTQSPTSGPSPTRTPTTPPGGFQPGDQVRSTVNVNLRSGPGTTFSVLGLVPTNTTGSVTGFPTSANGFTWYPVQMSGFPAGFMAGEFLVKTGSAPTATTAPGGFNPGDQIHVAVSALNLRQAAGTGATVIGRMPFGTNGSVTGAPVAANGYTWYPVAMFGFGSGWTAGEFLAAGVSAAAESESPPVTAPGTESVPTAAPEITETPVPLTATMESGEPGGLAPPPPPPDQE